MSFVTTLSPHILFFLALLLMHDGVDGVQIARMSPRDGGGHGGGGDGPDPATTSINIPPRSTSSPLSSHISSTSPIITSPSHTSSISPSHTSTTSLSSSTSSLPTSNPNSVRLAESRHIGTVVGAVLGSVILAGLGLMTFAYFRRRARKARKRPQGSAYFTEPQTEMSQTHNGPPLTSSAPLVHRPEPMHFFNASTRNITPSSLSPLIPAANSHDATISSRQLSISEPDGDFDVPSDPLQPPYNTKPLLPLYIPRQESAITAEPASSSTSGQLSPLHRDMAGFQKALEADHKRDISDQIDPPPEYIG